MRDRQTDKQADGQTDRQTDRRDADTLLVPPSPQGGYMAPDQVSQARLFLYSLLREVRKEAVPLVDAFDVPDQILNSALGRYDGDVYRHLYEWAQRAPRNKSKVRLSVCLSACLPACLCLSV